MPRLSFPLVDDSSAESRLLALIQAENVNPNNQANLITSTVLEFLFLNAAFSMEVGDHLRELSERADQLLIDFQQNEIQDGPYIAKVEMGELLQDNITISNMGKAQGCRVHLVTTVGVEVLNYTFTFDDDEMILDEVYINED